jgi:hypothetical protein
MQEYQASFGWRLRLTKVSCTKSVLTISLLFLAAAHGYADDKRVRLVQPKATASDLHLVELKKKDNLFAKFDGEVWLRGTFVVRWPAGAAATAYKTPDYILVPDRTSIAKLPYFVLNVPPFKNSYKIRTIEIQNGEEALRIAFTDEDVRKILGRKVNAIRVTGKFLIDAYVVGVECDAPWARAVLIKVDLQNQLAQAHQRVQEGC